MKKSSADCNSTRCELVGVGSLRPSAYNPRLTDPERLKLIELSIRKLGFLLPVYATPDGEILSGHQRHLVAMKLGLRLIPVSFTEPMELPERKALNIVFNRGTNDLEPWETPKDLTEALNRSNVFSLAKKIKDKNPDEFDFYRCMHPWTVKVKDLTRINSGAWKQHAANVSRTLQLKGILMPVIVTPDFRVVNGIGRLQVAASLKHLTLEAVQISYDEALFADAMLNLLSMDFDLHRRYDDLLRYNSFRRARRVRATLGRGFVFSVVGNKPCNRFDILARADKRRWIRAHGTCVLDFGAGHLHETNLLLKAGIECTPFEPYRLGHDSKINIEESRSLTRDFIKQVAGGRCWSSIFISSVLNSVPFESDRRHIVRICSVLCSPTTKVYAVASSTDQTDWVSLLGAKFLNKKNDRTIAFALEYEPGIKLGEFSSKPKVQKYHTTQEFKKLFLEAFSCVKCHEASNNVEAVAWKPRKLDAKELKKAISFEFDLPYPDGSRLGLVNEALAAFSIRTGVML